MKLSIFTDCGVGSLLENGNKELLRTIEVESGILEKEIYYSCGDGFILYPNETTRTCQSNAEWSSNTHLSCLAGKVVFSILIQPVYFN